MPEEYKKKNPADVFTFEFKFLPNNEDFAEEFKEQARQLKARFERNAQNSFFFPDAPNAERVPMDGLPLFI